MVESNKSISPVIADLYHLLHHLQLHSRYLFRIYSLVFTLHWTVLSSDHTIDCTDFHIRSHTESSGQVTVHQWKWGNHKIQEQTILDCTNWKKEGRYTKKNIRDVKYEVGV